MSLLYKDPVQIPVGKVKLEGDLIIPYDARGIIIFSHGSGSGRFSARNNMVALKMRQRNFGTLLFDLLTEEEDNVYANRFDIPLLTNRLIGVTEWLAEQEFARGTPLAYFGASTGAASALRAASELKGLIRAVVCRGGRPDLAMDFLPNVETPVMLVVGSLDSDVIPLNQMALRKLGSKEKELEIVAGATHLFEEPGKLERVADLAGDWYETHVSDSVPIH